MTAVALNSSWVEQRSNDVLRNSMKSRFSDDHTIADASASSNPLLKHRLKFVQPTKTQNARPQTGSSDSSNRSNQSYSTTSTVASQIKGRQSSAFDAPKKHLFEESKVGPLMNWDPKNIDNNGVGCGLRNLGNSCFMNASLQCIFYTPPLYNYLISRDHAIKCGHRGRNKFCFFCELQELVSRIFANNNRSDSYYSSMAPKSIFMRLDNLSRSLRPGRQEDAHEFITNLIDNLQDRALGQEAKKITDERVKETTVIHKIFGGYLRSQVKCGKCGKESNTYDAMLHLSLEIKGHSIDSALKHYTSNESLHGDNKYFCGQCKKKRNAHKKLTIFEPPNVLILHLKRFEYCHGSLGGHMPQYSRSMYSMHSNSYRGHRGYGRQGKIDKYIEFNETLDITHLQSYPIASKVTYSLFGALIHHGHSPNSGHYTSFIKAANNRWYYMDDSSVNQASISSVLRSNAYILFYVRNESKSIYKSPAISPRRSIDSIDLNRLKNVIPSVESGLFGLNEREMKEDNLNNSQSNQQTQRSSSNDKTESNSTSDPLMPGKSSNNQVIDSINTFKRNSLPMINHDSSNNLNSKYQIVQNEHKLKKKSKNLPVTNGNNNIINNKRGWNEIGSNSEEEPPSKRQRLNNMNIINNKDDSGYNESEHRLISLQKQLNCGKIRKIKIKDLKKWNHKGFGIVSYCVSSGNKESIHRIKVRTQQKKYTKNKRTLKFRNKNKNDLKELKHINNIINNNNNQTKFLHGTGQSSKHQPIQKRRNELSKNNDSNGTNGTQSSQSESILSNESESTDSILSQSNNTRSDSQSQQSLSPIIDHTREAQSDICNNNDNMCHSNDRSDNSCTSEIKDNIESIEHSNKNDHFLNANKRDIFEFLNDKTGGNISNWNDNDKNDNKNKNAVFKLNDFDNDFIPAKDEFEIEIDMNRMQSKKKQIRDINDRFKIFNSQLNIKNVKNNKHEITNKNNNMLNNFEAIQRGNISKKKNRKTQQQSRHKMQRNKQKYKNRNKMSY